MPGHDRAKDALNARLRTGFPWHIPEVPHPELSSPDSWWNALLPVFVRAFDGVLEIVSGAEAAWMMGDNPKTEIRGAEAVGLPAILVRGPKRPTRYHRENLYGVVDIVEIAQPRNHGASRG